MTELSQYRRYALYWAPAKDSPLARFGAAWLGWDAALGEQATHPNVPLDVAKLTEAPRRYGFHGTLKPPFRLAEGRSADALDDAAQALCARVRAFHVPPLSLRAMGSFIALVPSAPSRELSSLAARLVQDLDGFRARPTVEEHARRTAKSLNVRQKAHLAEWGYPYVMDEFRFHLTLSGPLGVAERSAAMAVLEPLVQTFTGVPLPFSEVCLFGEGADGRFRILRRYPVPTRVRGDHVSP